MAARGRQKSSSAVSAHLPRPISQSSEVVLNWDVELGIGDGMKHTHLTLCQLVAAEMVIEGGPIRETDRKKRLLGCVDSLRTDVVDCARFALSGL
jgi:hypothetical protein